MTKEDKDYEQSEGHPDLSNAGEPSTMKAHEAIAVKRKYGERKQSSPTSSEVSNSDNAKQRQPRKRRRLSSYDVSNYYFKETSRP